MDCSIYHVYFSSSFLHEHSEECYELPKNCKKLDEFNDHRSNVNNVKFFSLITKCCPDKSEDSIDYVIEEIQILVSCSDDFTIFLWKALETKTPIIRLTGHQQLVNHVSFSPNGRWLASSSFDKSVKLWEGSTGK